MNYARNSHENEDFGSDFDDFVRQNEFFSSTIESALEHLKNLGLLLSKTILLEHRLGIGKA